MKVLRIIFIILLILFVAYIVWMLFLPSTYRVERSQNINASKNIVFSEVSDFTKWENWAPWKDQDTTMEFQYAEQTSGVGASYSWTAQSGNGTQSFTAVKEFDTLRTHIEFEGQGDSEGLWIFDETKKGGTNVSWSFSGELNFFERSMGVFMEYMVGPMFESGLNKLKSVAEAKADQMKKEKSPSDFEVQVSTAEAMDYYSVQDRVEMENFNSDFFANRYAEIATYLGEDFENMTYHPFAIYHEWNEEAQMATVEVALPVDSDLKGTNRVIKSRSFEGDVLKVIFTGDYSQTGAAHEAIYSYATENNYEVIGSPMEVYVTDPGEEPDTNAWITEVIYPVASK